MSAIEISQDIFWVGVLDPDLRVFDVVMTTEHGTTYNAYLIKGRDKTVLLETVKEKYFEDYLTRLQELVSLSSIDYLIMNHTEPDHAGSVAKLLEEIPGLTVMGSPTALRFLKAICNKSFSGEELVHENTLDLGGKTLRFISAPFLHWPDTFYTYLEESKILFPVDSFGSHYSDERIFNDLIEFDYTESTKYYYDNILGPFRSYVVEGLDKIKDLEIDMICPGHGPLIRKDVQRYIDLYREWSAPLPEKARPLIIMAHVSAYGYTRMLADSIAEGIEAMGDFDLKRYDLVETEIDQVMAQLAGADGLLLGSCTINGDALPPIWNILTRMSPVTHSHITAAAFGSYGWSGEAVPNIEARLRALRMQILPGMRVNFKPSQRDIDDAFALGMDFARAILTKGQVADQKRWRCLVCGHIHQGPQPPDVCPACGVGPENFVEQAAEESFTRDTAETFVIVGGGIAGLSAARAVRERNGQAAIRLIIQDRHLPYYRPALSDLLGEDLPDERLFLFDASWYVSQNIEVRTGCSVKAINSAAKTLELQDGSLIDYDKLILATGARSRIPPLPGAGLQGVYSLRSMDDAFKIKKAMEKAGRVVVIGGGVLGLEAVWEMAARGLEVHVVEHFERLMPRQLDEESSDRLAQIIKAKKVNLHLASDVDEIVGGIEVEGVRLKDQTYLEADLVLLSTGVEPNLELAEFAGLVVRQGIVVDGQMRTNIPDIYAAGDVAQFGEKMIGLWPVAMEMGRVAGAAAAGDWVEYKEPSISTMLSAFEYEIFSVGEVNLPAEECRIVEVSDPAEKYFKRSYIKDGVLVGEIIIAPHINTSESMQRLGRDSSGKKRSNKWKCRVCGYIHEGMEAPYECPVCGAPQDMFDPV